MPRASPKQQSAKVPKGWPCDIIYTPKPVFSPKLTVECRGSLQKPDDGQMSIINIEGGPSSVTKITAIVDKSHPAFGQSGLFAAQHLPPNTCILPYLGYYHDSNDADPKSDYDLTLDRESGIAVDASKVGNEARFINDYRGTTATGPNAEFREIWVGIGSNKVEKRMAVYVLSAGKSGKRVKGIAKGEEILVSYGKGFWTERQREDTAPKPEQKGDIV